MDTDQSTGDGHVSGIPGIGYSSSPLESVTEALIFAADEPISARHIARVFSEVSGQPEPGQKDIDDVVEAINGIYELTDRSLRIQRWAGGYRMATTARQMPFLRAYFKNNRLKKLSRSLMETIAILAYRQPATRSDIEFVRGVDCDYALRKLMEFGLVDVVGRSQKIGRALLYGPTDKFLELFGLNTLSDLPNLRELEDLLDDPAFQKERAKALMTTGLQMLDLHSPAEDSGADILNSNDESPEEEEA